MRVFPVTRYLLAGGIRLGLRTTGRVFGVPAAVVPVVDRVLGFLDPRQREETFPFLSEAWIEAVHVIRESYRGKTSTPAPHFLVNFVITVVPFGDGTLAAHADTTSGDIEFELGHVDDPDATVTIDYATARALLVDADVNAALGAVAAGRIKVEGDLTKLLLLQAAPVDPVAIEAASRIRAITG